MGFISPVATNNNGTERQTGSLQALGKDDFLQLLVAQMEHQDPMEPMSNEESIAQLAQFSTLEQMNNIADGISKSNDLDLLQMQSLNNVMASGLIGKDAKASYNGIYFDSEKPSVINYKLPNNVDNVQFRITDSTGVTVATLSQDNMKAGVNSIEWDGTDNFGNRVADGYYNIEASASMNDGTTFTPSLSLQGTVESVIYRDGGAFLRIDGTEVPLGSISAVGEPGAFDVDNDDDESNNSNNTSNTGNTGTIGNSDARNVIWNP